MTIRDTQREVRKMNDFTKGAASAKTALVGRPKNWRGTAGATVGKRPKVAATAGGLTLVALGAGGKTLYDGRNGKYKPKRVSKAYKPDKEDAASAGIGGAAGAAVMPTRQPKAVGQRKYALNEMYTRAQSASKDGKADIKISPTELGQTAEHKGARAYNKGYTASSAKWNGFPEDSRYEIDMYKDKKGTVRSHQVNGRHLAEVRNMQERDIPTRVRLVEGEAPESPAWKTAYRYAKSRKERKQLRNERGLSPDTINRRASNYEGRVGSVARAANDKAKGLHHEANKTPVKLGRKNLKGRQAAFIGGGAGAMYVGNRILRGEKTGPTKAITGTSKEVTDKTRDRVAEAIDTKKVEKGMKMPNKKTMKVLKPLGTAVGAGTIGGVIANQLPQNQKDSRKIIKKRDNKDRYAAAGGGALAGAAVMPVRESAGGPGRKVARRLKDMPAGMQDVKTSDIMDVAAPGVRRGNKDYTTRMAADIAGVTDKPWDPEPGRIQITDDGARVTGGQHRAVARGWAGQGTQRMEVVRTPGKMGATSPGAVAAAKQVKRRLAPAWYKRNAPKDTADLIERNAKASEKKITHAKGHSTPSKAALDPVLDAKGMRKLHGKQAAIMAGGAGLALAGNEYRKEVSKGARTQAFKVGVKNFHPIRNRNTRRAAELGNVMGRSMTQGVADGIKANAPKMPDVTGAAKTGGKSVGAGLAAGGLLAGAGRVVGDALQANATGKAAKEATKRSKIYAGAGVGSAGLIGTGIAFNRKKK